MGVDDLPCPQCGEPNPADANFCSTCGVALPRGEDIHTETHTLTHVAVDAGGSEVPALVVIRGANAGSRFSIAAGTTIGRHPESTIFLDDVTVSRRHAEIVEEGDGLAIVDAGSLNGTYLNGERIERGRLNEGDQVQIGKYRFVFVVGVAGGDD